jgi:hypothetical protein
MNRSSTSAVIAGVIIAIQSFFGLLAGLAILRWDLHRHFLHPARVHAGNGLAVFIIIVSLIALVVAFSVATLQGWARIAGLLLEAFLLALFLLTFPFHPGLKLLDVLGAVVVIVLLLTDSTWRQAAAT